jgi:tRNA pseudouridine65 synthase
MARIGTRSGADAPARIGRLVITRAGAVGHDAGDARARSCEIDAVSAAIDILYRDEHLCAVMKPSGLAVHRGWAAAPRYALDVVRDHIGARVYPVHRLDQPTSGVLLFALSSECARALGESFASHRVHKRYLALVRGIPSAEELTVDHPVKDERGERVAAVTHLRRLWIFRRRYALVEARPVTGRTHQIRRHLKHLSCPIIGDTSYGKSEHNRLFATEFGLARLALHALALTLPHPTDGAPLTIVAPLPGDLAEPLARMGCPLELLDARAQPPAATVAP